MKILLAIILFSSAYSESPAQQSGDAILGKWLKEPKKDLIIEMYKTRGLYNGKISWSTSREKPAGFTIIEGLKYNVKSNSWEKGKIRDPNSSRVYSAAVKIRGERTLIVRGYKGSKLIGTSRTFTRVQSKASTR